MILGIDYQKIAAITLPRSNVKKIRQHMDKSKIIACTFNFGALPNEPNEGSADSKIL